MLWVCERCRTIHSQNPPECRECGHRIFDSMNASEYERKYDEEPPDAVDDAITMGTTPEPDFDSSPDVAVDGSVATDDGEQVDTVTAEDQRQGFLRRVWEWLF